MSQIDANLSFLRVFIELSLEVKVAQKVAINSTSIMKF